MRSFTICALLLATTAPTGVAQLPHLMPPGSSWIDVNYPKVFWTPREGLTGGAYLGFIRQLSYEHADEAMPYSAAVSIDGQLATSGSRQLTIEGRFPAFVNGWRFSLALETARRARENYFGIGNSSSYDESLVTKAQPRYYQLKATRSFARGEVQRQLVGGLRALAGFHAEHWRLAPHSGPSVLANDAALGVDPTIDVGTDDVAVRAGLVYDTRDDEVAANRGVLIQAIHAIAGAGLAGDLSYTRTTASIARYQPVGENLLLAGRFVAQGMGGTPRLGSYYLMEASDHPYFGLGGSMSHRALTDNRYLGSGKLLVNLDARYHVINLPRTARVTILGFLDLGRVFQGESFKLTTTALKVGGGGGLFLQVARAGIVGMTVGIGPGGAVMDFGTRWTY
ncbi:MAG: BamA/TamA family outer membrane protein [Gemmatimonadetes bacterium]|nr:BamA/TamA family outer membrane protein [Gemmatimonadota bacterium]